MSTVAAYLVTGGLLFIIGLHGLILRRSLLRKILALNIMDSGVFMILLSLAARSAPPRSGTPGDGINRHCGRRQRDGPGTGAPGACPQPLY